LKRIHSGIFVATLLLSAVLPPGLLAQTAGGGLVSGYANLVLGDGVMRTISLNAVSQLDGTATGQIEFNDPAPIPDQEVDGTGDPALAGSKSGVTLSAQVSCLVVVGDAAIVGGQVVASDPARYVGKHVLLLLTDSGKSPGVMSWGFYEPGQRVSCDSFPFSTYAQVEIAGGRIEVKQ
jgi:hypothetical protein